MPINNPPPPPPPHIERPGANAPRGKAPNTDKRKQFTRKIPQDEAQARAFIDGKIDMIRRDPNMTEEEKAAAIEDLKAKR